MLPDFGPILYGKTVFSVRLFCLQVLMQKQINYDKLSRNYESDSCLAGGRENEEL